MYTHLHLHSEFSLLDGLARIAPLMDRTRELGQEAIALTDHGVLYAALDFYREARSRGIKPIIGIEAYVAPGSRTSREAADKQAFHIGLLARNLKGYRNLLALVTRANLEGYYYKPRMDRELFQEHGEGLIALSGCNSSEVHRLLMDGRRDDALATLRFYQGVFDGVYLELQEHENMPEITAVNKQLVEIARETGLPLVATNDVHYVERDDAPIHEVLLCIGTNTSLLDEKRMRFSDDSYYLKSEDEMRALFPELPEAIDNTRRVAESCDLELDFGRLHLPDPKDLPPGVSPDEHLARLAREGLRRRYAHVTDEIERRLEYELDVVRRTGFTNYFFVVHDIARFARSRGILMGVRGSAAASLILYCLDVTDIEPLESRLVFERFLHAERKEPPDVDLDFAEDRRDEVMRYVAERYGYDRVAQIITFGTMGAKAAIRDTGRALGLSYGEADRVARQVPNALHMTIDRALTENAELRALYEMDPAVTRLVDTARRLEGLARHASTHAAGVVISREPLVEHVPLQRSSHSGEGAIPMTQFAMEQVAEIGLLKMDLLGLTNLTILDTAVRLIRETRGVDIDIHALPDGDAKSYEMLTKGETFGVFQLESAGMRRYVQDLKPTGIPDLAAMVALYRPGPMQHIPTYCRAKHGLENIRYPHPDLAGILDETYGVIVYQDQVLLIAQQFAGYTLGQADTMRKAMGKKIPEVMAAERERFLDGAREKGYRAEDAEAIFELILPFAGYAFNKAHAYCYGTIAYQTAYLKATYPGEYFTAVLMAAPNHPSGAQERIAAAVAESARLGIRVLGPDVNHSAPNFALEAQADGAPAIRFGLALVKNVGHGAAESVIAARDEGGPFASIDDFCRRVNLRNLNKRALESLIKAGALDCLGPRPDGRPYGRGSLLASIDRLVSFAQREQRLRETGQSTMFDLFGDSVATPMPALQLDEADIPKAEMLQWEKELLGVYVSEHPFTAAAGILATHVTSVCAEVTADLPSAGENGRGGNGASPTREVIVAGLITGSRPLFTRDGRPFLAVELEDLSGMLEVTVWPDLFQMTRELWEEGNIVLVQARVRERGDRLQVGVQRVALYQTAGETSPFTLPEWLSAERGPNGPVLAPRRAEVRSSKLEPRASNTESPAPSTQSLVITLRESDDEEADGRRLGEVMALLAQHPGADPVRLRVRQSNGDEVDLSLPPCAATEDLAQRLRSLVGEWGEVALRPLSAGQGIDIHASV